MKGVIESNTFMAMATADTAELREITCVRMNEIFQCFDVTWSQVSSDLCYHPFLAFISTLLLSAFDFSCWLLQLPDPQVI
jgi:hypothetical protein